MGPLSEGGVGAGLEGGGRNVGARRWGSIEDQREAGQSFQEGDSEVCQSVVREVASEGRGGDWGGPVQREVEGGEASCEGPGRVSSPEDGQ